ncbi:ParB/RepB/Spo0J family partition protein [Streptantibioticus ferralitis]|uniref:ParB N-terminal domain-containing protein n=2 Tax=Streptantibioticus ferralitis TaxID=236510 RepID=A0ABT5Z1P0_9ACTN|nr:ParB N-terminal domain-containing protein [Streptantibioticus ferralitis]MDF2257714.1 ParB N-terminal domain-containing protein [Streptantibioticus ferralitis]
MSCADEPHPEGHRQRARLPLSSLLPSDSPRIEGESEEHIDLLVKLDTTLPPVIVHRETMRIVDGMHRLRAAQLRGDESIEVEFFDGEAEDAFVLAVQQNITHGLPLSRADRTAAAKRILADHPDWADRRIAHSTGLAPGTVAALRQCSTDRNEQLNTRVGSDGRIRPLRATEGRLRASQLIADNPGASLREIATSAGIALATAKDVRDRLRQGIDPVSAKVSKTSSNSTVRANVKSAHGPAASRAALVPPVAADGVLPSLRNDPSLRTEAGRMLLQLLIAHSLDDEVKWRQLAAGVPGHRVAVVAQIARQCAEKWRHLACELDRRGL